ncbi:MAG: hypothetical protein U1E46_17015 [Hyphomicrobiales bacterium]
MQIRLRDQSDHFALESYICRNFAHCSPSTAFVHSALPFTGSPEFKRIRLNFVDRDGYQWIYVDTPGTYTIFYAPDLSVRLYLDDDFSHSISPAATLDTNDLPGALSASVEGLGHEGSTFALRRPFFIAVRNRTNGIQHPSIAVYHHRGDSPERAIVLTPHTDADTGFPYGQPLGIDDICWFRAFLPKTFNSALRTESFALRKPFGAYAAFTLKDSALQDVTTVEGDSEIGLDLVRPTQGAEWVYFTLARGSKDIVDFSIRWNSPVCFLALDLPTGFFIADESGPNIIGADEISLQITVDGAQLFNSYWDDADTGERWPGFAEALRGRLQQAMPGVRRLPFVQDITIAYREDDLGASGSLVEIVAALGPNDSDLVPRVVDLPIPDALGGGNYRFYCSLSRFPE